MLNIKDFLDNALSRGENLKEEITRELKKSKMVHEILKNEFFIKGLSTIIKTKDEVSKAIKDNVKNVLKVMQIPSKNDLSHLEHKLSSIEKSVDKVGKRAITVKSLRKISQAKAAKKVKTTSKKSRFKK